MAEDDSELPPFLKDSTGLDPTHAEKEVRLACEGNGPPMATWQELEELKERTTKYIAEHPGDYHRLLIDDMQKCGMARPSWIPMVDWNINVTTMGPIHHLICYMACYGMPAVEIARKLNKSNSWIKHFLRTQDAKTCITEHQMRIFGMEPRKWIEKTILPLAVQTALDIMNDKDVKAQTRLNAAVTFMDRGLGKPKQEIEVVDSTIRQLLERLDARDRDTSADRPVIDVTGETPEPPETAPPPSPAAPALDVADAWAKEYLNNG